MHKLLQRQIKRYLSKDFDPQVLNNVLNVISQAYRDHDTERNLLEQSLEEVSAELNERNALLKQQVDELKTADVHLRQSLAMIDSILEATGEAIFAFDQDCRLIRFNKAAREIIGMADGDNLNCSGEVCESLENIFRQSNTYEIERELLKVNQTAKINGSLKMEDGRYIEYYSSPQYSDFTVIGRVWCLRDITEQKKNEEIVKFNALHDELTRLPNRSLLEDRIRHAIALNERSENYIAILFLDLDYFKKVNDTVGHNLGDELLIEVTQRIGRCLRRYDTLARFGGDEFVILLEQLNSEEIICNVCSRIIEEIRKPFNLSMHSFYISCSIGISVYPSENASPSELIRQADLAMYQAKHNGRNAYEFFDPRLEKAVQRQTLIETRLRKGIEDEEFSVYFQPKIELATGKIAGLEALLRWFPKDSTTISPAEFVPIAERTGLIAALDLWVLRQVCKQIKIWQNTLGIDIAVSINLSAQQFKDPLLVNIVESILNEKKVAWNSIELEVTETMLMENLENATASLSALRAKGLKVAIDDFGTGYSSLQYLKRLPVDTLKIDRCFIVDIEENPNDQSIVSAIIALGHQIGLKVVAEGVEKQEAVQYLQQYQCDMIQGYFYYKPMPIDAVSELLRSQQ